MKTIPEQDKQVAEFLKSISVDYSVSWCGVNRKESSFPDADKWRVTFKKAGKYSKEFEFNTGSGNRYTKKSSLSISKSYLEKVKEITGLNSALIADSKTTKADRSGAYQDSYAITPTQASVLYCLLADAECGSLSFDDFCDNYGYDSDSMSDFKIYQACMQTTKDINNLFTMTERQQLQDLLQDY